MPASDDARIWEPESEFEMELVQLAQAHGYACWRYKRASGRTRYSVEPQAPTGRLL